MASNARYANFLFNLAEMGSQLQAPRLREGVWQILRLMPSDVHTMENLRTICRDTIKPKSPPTSPSTPQPTPVKLDSMYFDIPHAQALYNLEVTYALLMPGLNPMSEEAFEFQVCKNNSY
jgi:ubiquitin carboxyl-terminal hydrolase 9/24